MFFRKENAFNVIFFTLIVILAIFKNKETLLIVSPLLSCFILILSILSIVISVLEKLVDNYSETINDVLYSDYGNISGIYSAYNILYPAYKCKFNNGLILLKSFFYPTEYIEKDMLRSFISHNSRKILRIIRKVLLAFHYLILLCTLSLLILSEELKPLLITWQIGDFTIWSLVIILLQILLGDSITYSIFYELNELHDRKIDKIMKDNFTIKKKKENKKQSESYEELQKTHMEAFTNLWNFIDTNFTVKEQAVLLLLVEKHKSEPVSVGLSTFTEKALDNRDYFNIWEYTDMHISLSPNDYFTNMLLYSIEHYNKISSYSLDELENTNCSDLIAVG